MPMTGKEMLNLYLKNGWALLPGLIISKTIEVRGF
jgi:hypothetical protein